MSKKNSAKNLPAFPGVSNSLTYTSEFELEAALRENIRLNNALPVSKRRSRYEVLISSGYSEHRARALADILVEQDKFKEIKNKGFDEESAKLVIQEIAHDEHVKPEVRLKAAEDMLKVLGLFRESPSPSDSTGTILAQLLTDMFKRSENKPKIVTAIES